MVWTWDNGASVCNSMTWHSGLGGGRYQISVFIPSNYAYTTNARYRIQDFRGGNATQLNEVDVNRAVIYGAWVDLGTYRLFRGTGGLSRGRYRQGLGH